MQCFLIYKHENETSSKLEECGSHLWQSWDFLPICQEGDKELVPEVLLTGSSKRPEYFS